MWYRVSTLGTLERIALDWMKEEMVFSMTMFSLFFDRVKRVLDWILASNSSSRVLQLDTCNCLLFSFWSSASVPVPLKQCQVSWLCFGQCLVVGYQNLGWGINLTGVFWAILGSCDVTEQFVLLAMLYCFKLVKSFVNWEMSMMKIARLSENISVCALQFCDHIILLHVISLIMCMSKVFSPVEYM